MKHRGSYSWERRKNGRLTNEIKARQLFDQYTVYFVKIPRVKVAKTQRRWRPFCVWLPVAVVMSTIGVWHKWHRQSVSVWHNWHSQSVSVWHKWHSQSVSVWHNWHSQSVSVWHKWHSQSVSVWHNWHSQSVSVWHKWHSQSVSVWHKWHRQSVSVWHNWHSQSVSVWHKWQGQSVSVWHNWHSQVSACGTIGTARCQRVAQDVSHVKRADGSVWFSLFSDQHPGLFAVPCHLMPFTMAVGGGGGGGGRYLRFSASQTRRRLLWTKNRIWLRWEWGGGGEGTDAPNRFFMKGVGLSRLVYSFCLFVCLLLFLVVFGWGRGGLRFFISN